MKTLSMFLNESLSFKRLPFNSDPEIGWWKDQNFLLMYHGSHRDHIPSFEESGVSRPDPNTGLVSMAFVPNDAFGYAAMSCSGGEAKFVGEDGQPEVTPPNQRVVFVTKLPMDWVLENHEAELGGNMNLQKFRLENQNEYKSSKQKGMKDSEYYQLTELRFKKSVPPRYIIGYMIKG